MPEIVTEYPHTPIHTVALTDKDTDFWFTASKTATNLLWKRRYRGTDSGKATTRRHVVHVSTQTRTLTQDDMLHEAVDLMRAKDYPACLVKLAEIDPEGEVYIWFARVCT